MERTWDNVPAKRVWIGDYISGKGVVTEVVPSYSKGQTRISFKHVHELFGNETMIDVMRQTSDVCELGYNMRV